MLTDGNSTRTYNNRNRQISYSDGETTTNYTYYVDGLRKSKKIGNSETQYFIWHNGNMVYEFTSEDANTYAYGLGIFASDDARYLLNAHGDVIYTINAQGNTIYWYDYDAFGNQLNYLYPEDTNPFRYCGEYYDKETGTIYLRARYYSPVSGRFTTKDPHWNVNNMIYGNAFDETNGVRIPDLLAVRQSTNLYGYCVNSPIAFEDKTGESAAALLLMGGVVVLLLSGCEPARSQEEFAQDAAKNGNIVYGSSTKTEDKLYRQMSQRGWSVSQVESIRLNPFTIRVSTNLRTGNSATVYYDEDGNYVIIDDVTNEVVQISDKFDPNWIPDSNIKDPYHPEE